MFSYFHSSLSLNNSLENRLPRVVFSEVSNIPKTYTPEFKNYAQYLAILTSINGRTSMALISFRSPTDGGIRHILNEENQDIGMQNGDICFNVDIYSTMTIIMITGW